MGFLMFDSNRILKFSFLLFFVSQAALLAVEPHWALRNLAGSGTAIRDMMLRDFDSDGDLDLVTVSSVYWPTPIDRWTSTVAFDTANGDGVFATYSFVNLNGQSNDIAYVSDRDRYAVSSDWNDSVFVVSKNGNISYQLKAARQPGAAASGNVSGDYRHDIVVTDVSPGFQPGITIFQGTADGFANGYFLSTGATGVENSVKIGNIDGDQYGLNDVVVGGGGLKIFYSDTVSFSGLDDDYVYHSGSSVTDMELVDMDNDGDLDIVVASDSNPTDCVAIYWNQGNRTFSSPQYLTLPNDSDPSVIVAQSLYGADNIPDIVVGCTGSGKVSFFYSNGAGSYPNRYDYEEFAWGTGNPTALAFGNLRANSIVDMAVNGPNTYTGYLCGDADGSRLITISDQVFIVTYIFGGGPAPVPLASADADCTGLITISDAVYLATYIFGGGPAPCADCPLCAPWCTFQYP